MGWDTGYHNSLVFFQLLCTFDNDFKVKGCAGRGGSKAKEKRVPAIRECSCLLFCGAHLHFHLI